MLQPGVECIIVWRSLRLRDSVSKSQILHNTTTTINQIQSLLFRSHNFLALLHKYL